MAVTVRKVNSACVREGKRILKVHKDIIAKRKESSRKETEQLAKDVSAHFKSKAKDKTYSLPGNTDSYRRNYKKIRWNTEHVTQKEKRNAA